MAGKRLKLKIGDFFRFPFGYLNGEISYGYGKIIDIDHIKAPFIGFYAADSHEELSYAEIIKRPYIFKNWCGLIDFKNGSWEILENVPVFPQYEIPYFICTVLSELYSDIDPQNLSEIPKTMTIEKIINFHGIFHDMVDQMSAREISSKDAELLNFSYKKSLFGSGAAREQFRMRMNMVFNKDYLRIPDEVAKGER